MQTTPLKNTPPDNLHGEVKAQELEEVYKSVCLARSTVELGVELWILSKAACAKFAGTSSIHVVNSSFRCS